MMDGRRLYVAGLYSMLCAAKGHCRQQLMPWSKWCQSHDSLWRLSITYED